MTIDVKGEKLLLHPERALYWAREKLLAFSDVHLGKAESLQAEGIAIPAEAGASDLRRMSRLVDELGPREVFILGDFIHQKTSWSQALQERLGDFFAAHRAIQWTLILGNHERGSLKFLERYPIRIEKDYVTRGPLTFSHHGSAGPFTVEGHIHPVVTLRQGPLRMRFPCFELAPEGITLPAFGTWTGGAEVAVRRNHRYFAVTEREVFELELAH